MIEQGIVTKLEKGKATVKVDKKDECSKCGMCLFPKGASSIDFEADNKILAQVGDTVVIQTQKEGKLLGATLAFLIPLILVICVLILNYFVIFNELIALGIAVMLIVIWYAILLALIDKKLKNSVSFAPSIIKIVAKADQINKEENIEKL